MRKRCLLVAALLPGTACLPIPVPRDVTVRLGVELDVAKADGTPAPGVAVTMRRYISGPPPATETHRWEGRTDASGHLSLPTVEARESHMPLMMHGVNWYAWEICATHPEPGSANHVIGATQPVMPPATLSLALDATRPDCGWEDMPTLK